MDKTLAMQGSKAHGEAIKTALPLVLRNGKRVAPLGHIGDLWPLAQGLAGADLRQTVTIGPSVVGSLFVVRATHTKSASVSVAIERLSAAGFGAKCVTRAQARPIDCEFWIVPTPNIRKQFESNERALRNLVGMLTVLVGGDPRSCSVRANGLLAGVSSDVIAVPASLSQVHNDLALPAVRRAVALAQEQGRALEALRKSGIDPASLVDELATAHGNAEGARRMFSDVADIHGAYRMPGIKQTHPDPALMRLWLAKSAIRAGAGLDRVRQLVATPLAQQKRRLPDRIVEATLRMALSDPALRRAVQVRSKNYETLSVQIATFVRAVDLAVDGD